MYVMLKCGMVYMIKITRLKDVSMFIVVIMVGALNVECCLMTPPSHLGHTGITYYILYVWNSYHQNRHTTRARKQIGSQPGDEFNAQFFFLLNI